MTSTMEDTAQMVEDTAVSDGGCPRQYGETPSSH
jgi:hypothetical protein